MRINHRDGLTKLKKMATRIRLSRHGRKKQAFYHIVVAEQRSPRDGRFIEKIGIYNPNTNPATIKIDQEKDFTCRSDFAALLSSACKGNLA